MARRSLNACGQSAVGDVRGRVPGDQIQLPGDGRRRVSTASSRPMARRPDGQRCPAVNGGRSSDHVLAPAARCTRSSRPIDDGAVVGHLDHRGHDGDAAPSVDAVLCIAGRRCRSIRRKRREPSAQRIRAGASTRPTGGVACQAAQVAVRNRKRGDAQLPISLPSLTTTPSVVSRSAWSGTHSALAVEQRRSDAQVDGRDGAPLWWFPGRRCRVAPRSAAAAARPPGSRPRPVLASAFASCPATSRWASALSCGLGLRPQGPRRPSPCRCTSLALPLTSSTMPSSAAL